MNSNLAKNKLIMIVAVVALLAFLFLPILNATMGVESTSPNGFDYVSGEFEVETPYGTQTYPAKLSIDMILIMAAAVVAAIGGYTKSKKAAIAGGILGFAFLLINIINPQEYFKAIENAGGSVSYGLGMWIPLIAFAAITVLAWMMGKEEEEVPAQIQQ